MAFATGESRQCTCVCTAIPENHKLRSAVPSATRIEYTPATTRQNGSAGRMQRLYGVAVLAGPRAWETRRQNVVYWRGWNFEWLWNRKWEPGKSASPKCMVMQIAQSDSHDVYTPKCNLSSNVQNDLRPQLGNFPLLLAQC